MFAFAIAKLAALVGPKWAKPLLILIVILLLFGGGFILAKCTGGNDEVAAQAEQTTRSGEAMANSAEAAVETISNRAVTEQDIDRITANVQEGIGNAQSPNAVRDAVLDGVCRQSSHRNDPACTVRRAPPR